MKLNSNTLLIILTTAIVAAGAYWYFFVNNDVQTSLTSSVVQNQSREKFQTLISQLEPISFETSLFSDPRFTGLYDLTTPIAPEPAGRSDPFALVGAVPRPR